MAAQINETLEAAAGGELGGAAPPATVPASAGVRRRFLWLSWIVSDDPPGRALLNVTLLVLLAALLFAPFLFPGTKALGVASRICIFVILVASYDLMLGFTGIVSFA